MLLNKIHHIAIIGSDYEKSKEFYVEKLGFKVLRENYRTDKNDWKIDLILNNEVEIELFIIKNPPKRLSNPEANGLRHLAFKVENIEKIVNELNLKGIICEPIRTDPYTNKKMTFFKDPDDLPLELHE